jgi:hypothetical protein
MSAPEPRPLDDVLAQVRADGTALRADRNRRHRRRIRVATGLGAVAVLAVGALAVARFGDRDDGGTVAAGPTTSTVPSTATSTPLDPSDPVTPMATSPLSARSRAVTAWTGREILIWGGQGATSDVCMPRDGENLCGDPAPDDGAAYDPSNDTWRMLPSSPLHANGSFMNFIGVWTGTELVVWGGKPVAAAAYNPTTDAWRSLDAGTREATYDQRSVWTGTEMVVASGATADGYDPTTNSWRTLPDVPAPSARITGLTWTGTDLVVTAAPDGEVDDSPAFALADGATAWRPFGTTPFPNVAGLTTVDGHVVAVGRRRAEPDQPDTRATYATADGSGSWTTAPSGVDVGAREFDGVLDAGGLVVAYGSTFFPMNEEDPDPDNVVAFAVDGTDDVHTIGTSTGKRAGLSAVWTGQDLFVWGGAPEGGFGGQPVADGVRITFTD